MGEFDASTITLTTLGGTLGEESLSVSHLPVFELGQQYIVFTDPDRTTYDPVTGNTHGVFLVEPDQSQVYTYEGIAVAGVADGMLQLGPRTLADEYAQDPQGIGTQTESPVFQGEIVEMVPAEPMPEAAMPTALSVEEFAAIVQDLGGQHDALY